MGIIHIVVVVVMGNNSSVASFLVTKVYTVLHTHTQKDNIITSATIKWEEIYKQHQATHTHTQKTPK